MVAMRAPRVGQDRRLAFFRAGVFALTFFRGGVFALAFFRARGFAALSGSFLVPVSRFHSSNVSFEIFPSTRSCANLRRCAWLLNGIEPQRLAHGDLQREGSSL